MIEAGDSAGAATAMAAHLDGLLTDIPDIRRLNPEYFAEAQAGPALTIVRANARNREDQDGGESTDRRQDGAEERGRGGVAGMKS